MTLDELEKCLLFLVNECRIYRRMYERAYEKNVKLTEKLIEIGGEVD